MHPWYKLFQERVFQGPLWYQWDFGIGALDIENIRQLSTLPELSEDPSVLGLIRAE